MALSEEAEEMIERLAKEQGRVLERNKPPIHRGRKHQLNRDDPLLVHVVETLGPVRASGKPSLLRIIEIPADVDWVIVDYDGLEHIAERHRTWRLPTSYPYG